MTPATPATRLSGQKSGVSVEVEGVVGMQGLRILVCGGRDYADAAHAHQFLDWLNVSDGPIGLVIGGGAKGADRIGQDWAISHGIRCTTFFADWKAHGRAAGPIRNAAMLTEGRPDVVVAFPGGRGTNDMVSKARAADVRVVFA